MGAPTRTGGRNIQRGTKRESRDGPAGAKLVPNGWHSFRTRMKAISAGNSSKRSSGRLVAMFEDWDIPVRFKMARPCCPDYCAVGVAAADSRCSTQEGSKMSSDIVVFAVIWITVSPNASHSVAGAWMKLLAVNCCASLDQRQWNPQ